MRASRCAGPCAPAGGSRDRTARQAMLHDSQKTTASSSASSHPRQTAGQHGTAAWLWELNLAVTLSLPGQLLKCALPMARGTHPPETTTTQRPSTPCVRRVPLCTLYLHSAGAQVTEAAS